ncbi:MAG: hypothetical protein LBQ05_01260 [Christensenellaceae bacterium]|jgi:hypothetical protein|nr:hypothetical protein [Christensenellaceae bacterium]
MKGKEKISSTNGKLWEREKIKCREMKFGVSDIRLFNSCNLEFLKGVK